MRREQFPLSVWRRDHSVPAQMGFEVVRVKGSHHFLRHPDGRCTVVLVHRGETIGRGLLAQILRDCDFSREELLGNL